MSEPLHWGMYRMERSTIALLCRWNRRWKAAAREWRRRSMREAAARESCLRCDDDRGWADCTCTAPVPHHRAMRHAEMAARHAALTEAVELVREMAQPSFTMPGSEDWATLCIAANAIEALRDGAKDGGGE